ncbi:MAG: translocation/assembly module TamB domain-containing protein [Ferruginibacter sp.]|nr:translocation/assembly module TamB domain-containing protein [Ferruginibacter sp.]
MTSSKFLKKAGKIVLYISLIVLVLLVGSIIFIQTSSGKKFVRNRVQSFLQKKLNTTVAIGSVDYSFPKWLELQKVYVEDRQKDTLLYGRKMSVDLDMIKLLSGEVDIQKVELHQIQAHLSRTATDSNFNFQFIIDAFLPKEDLPVAADTTSLALTLKRLILQEVSLRFNDKYAGNAFTSAIGHLELTMNKFQPDKWLYDIASLKASNLNFIMHMTEPGTKLPGSEAVVASYYPVRVNAGAAEFKDVNVAIDDHVSGMKYSNYFRLLSGNGLAVDLEKQYVGLRDISLESSMVNFEAGKRAQFPADTSKVLWTVEAGKISLKGNDFRYDDNEQKRTGGLDYAHINSSGVNLNAENFFYSADSTSTSLRQFSFVDKGGFRLDTAKAQIRFTNQSIIAEELYVKTPGSVVRDNLRLKFADLTSMLSRPGSTEVNARMVKSTIAIDDLYAVAPLTRQYLDPAKFRHTSFHLNTELTGTLEKLYIPYLQFAGLSGTRINGRGTIYNVTDPKKLSYDITLFNSSIPRQDMARFVPASNQELLASLPKNMRLGGRLKGDLQSLNSSPTIQSDQFDFDGDIGISNFSNPAKLAYDIRVKNTRIQKAFLFSIIDPKMIPANIRLPETIIATGTLSGNMNEVKTNLKTGGSYGQLAANGFVKNFKDPERAVYDLQLGGKEFAIGSLIRQDSLFDKISFKALVRGTGYNYRTMRGTMSGDIASVDYNNYKYKNISLNARFDKGQIESSGRIEDSSLRFTYLASANVNAAYPIISGSFQLDTLMLKNLHFFNDTMNVSLSGTLRAENLDPHNLNVYAQFDSGRVFYKSRTFVLDSIKAFAETVNQQTTARIRSAFLDADANGHFAYNTIGPAIIQYIDQYYNISDSIKTDNANQQIAFNGVIKKHPLVLDLIPGLNNFENILFKGGYSSDYGDSALNLSVTTPFVHYDTKSIRNISLNLNARNGHLEYGASFDTLNLGKTTLFKTSLRGAVANDTIALIAEAFDDKNVPRYIAGGTLFSKDKMFSLAISDSMLLNYQRWNVSPRNNINYSRLGILVTDFVLTNDSASISANSQQKMPNSPIDIVINNFDIRDVTTALNQDTLLAEGLVNARINVSEFNKKLPAFTGTASVKELKVMQSLVGNIDFSASRQSENTITGKIHLSENDNDVTLNGNYYLNNDAQQFDATLDVKKLSLATLQGFSNGYMTRASGALSGLLDLKGKVALPEWKGELRFDSAKFTVARFGTTYLMNKENIVFDYPSISFKDFTVRDSLNNPFIVNGNIRSRNLFEYDLALDLNSRDFTLINAPKAINNLLYGFAALDVNVSVSGTSELPNIEGDVYVNEKSDLTMVLPEKNIDKDAARSLVRFIDRDTFALPETREFRPTSAPVVNFARFVNYNLNLQIDKEAALTIIIDPSTGDELKVQGDASLNAGVDPGGNIILAGDYLLNSGYYVLNYQFLSKRFELIKGSAISFAGEPMDAQIDMTAQYIANTSPKELLGNEVGSVDPKFAYSFNQKIPFRVILLMKGSLKRPSISFDIQLPEEGAISSNLRTTIDNKLVQLREDVAATNKQVFALLALGRFVGEQSTDFFKGSGGGFNDLARESVSKFLSAALDQIASDLFKGINIDLNLNSYKDFTTSTGTQRTDLNVEVSKNFLNDRLNVTVGKNFGIEGQDGSAKAAQQKGSRFLPDVTVNYKLSKDGKYRLRAYNKNQFEVILDGYIVETGIGFIVTMDYDKFQELFVKKKEEKK